MIDHYEKAETLLKKIEKFIISTNEKCPSLSSEQGFAMLHALEALVVAHASLAVAKEIRSLNSELKFERKYKTKST